MSSLSPSKSAPKVSLGLSRRVKLPSSSSKSPQFFSSRSVPYIQGRGLGLLTPFLSPLEARSVKEEGEEEGEVRSSKFVLYREVVDDGNAFLRAVGVALIEQVALGGLEGEEEVQRRAEVLVERGILEKARRLQKRVRTGKKYPEYEWHPFCVALGVLESFFSSFSVSSSKELILNLQTSVWLDRAIVVLMRQITAEFLVEFVGGKHDEWLLENEEESLERWCPGSSLAELKAVIQEFFPSFPEDLPGIYSGDFPPELVPFLSAALGVHLDIIGKTHELSEKEEEHTIESISCPQSYPIYLSLLGSDEDLKQIRILYTPSSLVSLLPFLKSSQLLSACDHPRCMSSKSEDVMSMEWSFLVLVLGGEPEGLEKLPLSALSGKVERVELRSRGRFLEGKGGILYCDLCLKQRVMGEKMEEEDTHVFVLEVDIDGHHWLERHSTTFKGLRSVREADAQAHTPEAYAVEEEEEKEQEKEEEEVKIPEEEAGRAPQAKAYRVFSDTIPMRPPKDASSSCWLECGLPHFSEISLLRQGPLTFSQAKDPASLIMSMDGSNLKMDEKASFILSKVFGSCGEPISPDKISYLEAQKVCTKLFKDSQKKYPIPTVQKSDGKLQVSLFQSINLKEIHSIK